jgi:hypothetical protein
MGKEYNIKFTNEEIEKFTTMENFGVDIRELKQLLAKPVGELMKPENHTKGIPFQDSLNDQLSSWVRHSRESTYARKKDFVKVAIKGNAEEKFGTVNKVVQILQEQRQNRFYLVTGLRDSDF